MALEDDTTASTREAGDGVEHRGLPRAVGADEAEHHAAFGIEADIVDGQDAAVVDGETGDGEGDVGHQLTASIR